MRTARCEDCGASIPNCGRRGPVPRRCATCKPLRTSELKKAKGPSKSNRKECEQCGKEFMTAHKNQKCCCRECSLLRSRNRVIVTCQNEECGKEFEVNFQQSRTRRFCSRDCFSGSRRVLPRTCLQCGEEFVRHAKKDPSHDAGLYCGKPCYFAAVRSGSQRFRGQLLDPMKRMISWFHDWAAEGAKAAREIERTERLEPCRECGSQCEPGRSFCSRECLYSHRVTTKCPSCGSDVHGVSILGSDPLCNHCSRERSKQSSRKSRRTHNAKYGNWRRRCSHYGGYFNPAVKRDAIFERDGYRCHVCKRRLPKKYSHDNPRSPTVDHHPVPLSKGGDHDWHNVRCCCMDCNSRKGAAWDGQMLLTLPP